MSVTTEYSVRIGTCTLTVHADKDCDPIQVAATARETVVNAPVTVLLPGGQVTYDAAEIQDWWA